MPEIIEVPAAIMDNALEAHAEMDAAAHAQIAQTEDEDYKWLTDRLDALQTEVVSLRSSGNENLAALMTAFNENREQSRTLIEAQTSMIATLTENLTALSQSALLRSLPNDSETSSETVPEPIAEPIAETVPVVSANQEPPTEVERVPGSKKRTRI